MARKKPAKKKAGKKKAGKKKSTAVVARKSAKKGGKRKPAKKRKGSKSTAVVAVKKGSSKKGRKGKKHRGGFAAFNKPQHPDAVLAAIIGSKAISRPQMTKKIWAHIKRHKLQDRSNKRMIVCSKDAKMKAFCGGKAKVSMFTIAKFLSRHIKSR